MNFTLKTFDGYELFCQYDAVENAQGTLVFSHGFVEYGAHYSRLGSMVNARGYNLLKYDLRGHGRTTAPLGDVKNFEDFENDLSRCVQWVKDQDSTLPVFTMGFSLGGMITVLYGILNPFDVDGQVLLGPGLRENHSFVHFDKDTLSIHEFLDLMGTAGDAGIKQLVAMDSPYVLKTVTRSFVQETFVKAQKFINDHVDSVTLPTVIYHGRNDPMIPYTFSESFINRIASTDKTCYILDGFEHDLLRTKHAQEIVSKITDWCSMHI